MRRTQGFRSAGIKCQHVAEPSTQCALCSVPVKVGSADRVPRTQKKDLRSNVRIKYLRQELFLKTLGSVITAGSMIQRNERQPWVFLGVLTLTPPAVTDRGTLPPAEPGASHRLPLQGCPHSASQAPSSPVYVGASVSRELPGAPLWFQLSSLS